MAVVDDVRAYYEVNTSRFERFGQGGGTIHRAVWGKSVKSRAEAFRHVDELVWLELEPFTREGDATHVLDLGCGVGASLAFLASRADIRATGATLSGVQAARARERARHAALEPRVAFIEANFLGLPSSVPKAHLAFSIEAFVHGPDPRAYFEAASRYLFPGGLLIVCDDFLTQAGKSAAPAGARRCLDDVRTGWLANTLVTADEATELAASAGFERRKNLDLTPFLELARPRDRLITALVTLGRPFPLRGFAWRSIVGGSALQKALTTGLLEYRFLVWQKRGSEHGVR